MNSFSDTLKEVLMLSTPPDSLELARLPQWHEEWRAEAIKQIEQAHTQAVIAELKKIKLGDDEASDQVFDCIATLEAIHGLAEAACRSNRQLKPLDKIEYTVSVASQPKENKGLPKR